VTDDDNIAICNTNAVKVTVQVK